MTQSTKPFILAEAVICSLGFIVFAYFINNEFPARLISFGGLLLSGIIIARNLQSASDLRRITGEYGGSRRLLLLTVSGIVLGSILSALYRKHTGVELFPHSIHFFAFIAALIGSTEELIFRGFIQEHVREINGPFSVIFSALSHTGYKLFLFLSPAVIVNVDTGFLAFFTFLAGIVFGIVKDLSGSLIPAVTAHALFDILVYAEFVHAPWWVW